MLIFIYNCHHFISPARLKMEYSHIRWSHIMKVTFGARFWSFGGSDCKESACNAGDPGLIPGLGRFPWRRKWQPTAVFLPRKYWVEEPGRLQSMELERVRHNWVTSLSFFSNNSEALIKIKTWLQKYFQAFCFSTQIIPRVVSCLYIELLELTDINTGKAEWSYAFGKLISGKKKC